MSNAAIIGFPIHSDEATLSGGAWGLAPLANMQSDDPTEKARSTNALAASTQFDCDHGSPVVARIVALVAHNMSKAAKVRLRASGRVDFGLLAPVAPDISKAPWADNGTPVVTTVTGPDGELSGYSINDNDAGVTEFRYIVLSTSGGNGTKPIGVWIKKGTATVTDLVFWDATASAYRLRATITWVGTTPGTPAVSVGTYVSQQIGDDGLWYYLTFTTSSVTAANSHTFQLRGATEAVGTTGTTFYAFPGYCTRNLVTSSDISGGSWTDSGTPIVSVTTGPLGAQDGYTLYDNDGAAEEGRYIPVQYASGGSKAVNVWAKKGSSARSFVQLWDNTASANRLLATITWVGTTPGTPVMTAGTYVSQAAGANGWYLLRFLSTSALVAANTNRLLLSGSEGAATGTTAWALPWTEDETVCYEDRYNSGWVPAYRQIYAGPSNLLDAYQALGSWTLAGTNVAARGYPDPNGGMRAFLLTDDDGAGIEAIYHSAAFLTDGTKAFRVYMKAGTASVSTFSLHDNTLGNVVSFIKVTWSAAGVPTLSVETGSATLGTPVDAGGGWWLLSATSASIVSAHDIIFILYPAGHDSSTATVGTVYVFQPWAEDAATFATAILQTGESGYTDGKVSQTQLNDGYPFHFIHVLTSNVLAQYWRVEIDDTANVDTYVEIGRGPLVTFGYEATINFIEGYSAGWRTSSTAVETDGGGRYVDEHALAREAAFTFHLPEDNELMVRHQDFMQRVGMVEQIIWVEEPDATLHAHRKNYLAQLVELSKYQKPYVLQNTQAYAIREVI